MCFTTSCIERPSSTNTSFFGRLTGNLNKAEAKAHMSIKRKPKPPPEKRGYLEKRSPRMLAGWQSRYFVLKDGVLTYYKKGMFDI